MSTATPSPERSEGSESARSANSAQGARRESARGAVFRHDALFHAGDHEFVARSAAFVRDGLEQGEPVLIAVAEPRASLLRENLSGDAGDVGFMDMQAVGRNPARMIPAWQEWVERNEGAGKGFRGIGEPIWAGPSPAELVEHQQHEHLLNTAFQQGPAWWLLCPYDTQRLPASLIAWAHDAHSGTSSVPPAQRGRSATPPESALFAEPLPEPPAADVVYRAAFRIEHLSGLRRELAACATVRGATPDRVRDLVLVADELAGNSIRHGGGAGTLRMWREGRTLVCEVRDAGLVTDPLIGRRRPTADTGAGLWIANQLCDLVQIRSGRELGTVVRVHFGRAIGAA